MENLDKQIEKAREFAKKHGYSDVEYVKTNSFGCIFSHDGKEGVGAGKSICVYEDLSVDFMDSMFVNMD